MRLGEGMVAGMTWRERGGLMVTSALAATLGIGVSSSTANWTSDDPHLGGASMRNGPSPLFKRGLHGPWISKA